MKVTRITGKVEGGKFVLKTKSQIGGAAQALAHDAWNTITNVLRLRVTDAAADAQSCYGTGAWLEAKPWLTSHAWLEDAELSIIELGAWKEQRGYGESVAWKELPND